MDFARTAERMAKALNHEGLQLSYHNHHMEFARIDGRYILDWIRSEAPSLHFEIDVYWTQRGGLDPVRVLADYAGLVDLVHLKDYRIGVPSDDAFAALAAGDQETWSQHWNQLAQFAEVGHGNLDFPAIIEQAVASGAQHLIIEQDEQYGRDIYDCLADSRANLSQMGYESMF